MNNDNLVIDTRADISEGCPMRCGVDGSNTAHVLVDAGGKAVAEMNARCEQQDAGADAMPP